MTRLLLLFVVLPTAELALLIEVGKRVGTGATLALIVATGIVGASLARRQGLGVVGVVQRETAAGRLPASTLIDGVIILLAGALLVTPDVGRLRLGVEDQPRLPRGELGRHLRDLLLDAALDRPVVRPVARDELLDQPAQRLGAEVVRGELDAPVLRVR